MIKQIPGKYKNIFALSFNFDPRGFDLETPFSRKSEYPSQGLHCSRCRADVCSCSAAPDKISFHSSYNYTKNVLVDGKQKRVRSLRCVMDLDCDRNIIEKRFEVKNYKCEQNKDQEKNPERQKYHAYLPLFVPKYGRYSYRFIFTVLEAYLDRKNQSLTVAELCERFEIGVTTLYRWIKLFMEQFRVLCSAAQFPNTMESKDQIDDQTACFLLELIRSITIGMLYDFYDTVLNKDFMGRTS